ncbi:MAG: phage major capsid protein [Opitutae bacterium]
MNANTERQIKSEIFHREGSFNRDQHDEENRTIELSFSSETPVSRYFGYEILDHKKTSVDLSRLNDSAPLLVNHNTDDQVGVVEVARLEDGKGRAVVRFSRSERGEEIYRDVLDGIRKNVSVGYRINELVLEKSSKENETYRATSWTPMEISLASVPADNSVGVGRSQEFNPNPNPNMEQTEQTKTASDAAASAPTVNNETISTGGTGQRIEVVTDEKQIRAQEARRSADIIASARQWDIPDATADEYIRSGKSVADFNELVMSKLAERNQPTPLGDGGIGLSRKEAKQWSFARAIRSVMNNGRVDGFEREVSDAVAKRLNQDPAGFYIPTDIAHERSLTADTASTGGYLVDDQLQSGSFIEILRNKMKVKELGARMLTGLTSNVTIPTQETAGTAETLAENAQITGSNPTFGQKTLSPHRIGAKVPISKQLIQQSSSNVEAIVREDVAQIIALETDRQCLHGDPGTAGEIKGLANADNINTVTFGATATWAKAVEFETDIAAANGDIGVMAYLTDAAVRGAWKTIKKDSGSGIFLWENNMVNGYNAMVSQQVSGSKVFFGVWNQLLLGEFGAIDVVVDNLTLADKHQVQLVVNYLCDMVVRQPKAFSVSTDSGNQ